MRTIITILVILTAFSALVNAQEYYKVTASELNARECPDKKCDKVFSLGYGERVLLVQKETSGWFLVEYNSQQGYVSSDYIEPVIMAEVEVEEPADDGMKTLWGYALYIVFGFGGFMLLLLLIIKGTALRIIGSTITLLACIVYYVLGIFLNMFFVVALAQNEFTGLVHIIVMVCMYVLALVVLILSIVGYFRNTGVAIIVLSVIIGAVDYYIGAIPGFFFAYVMAWGGILISLSGGAKKNNKT